MKKLVILGALIAGTQFSNAQDLVVENNDRHQVLYRGFENRLSIGQAEMEVKNYEIQGINCEVVEESKGSLIVKVKSKAKTAKIIFSSNGKALDTAEFIVQNLPAPDLYWGNARSGTKATESREIHVKYSGGILLKADFEISKWELRNGDKVFSGNGNQLSDEAMASLSSLKAGSIVAIIAIVKSEDGIKRKLGGSWEL